MEISKIMSKNPVVLKPNDNLEKLFLVFSKNRFSGCPVVDTRKNVVGIITETDILRIIDLHYSVKRGDSSLLPLILGVIKSGEHFEDIKKGLKKILSLPVKDFMSKDIITVNANDDVYRAARLMNKNKINRLPVMKKDRLVGIISREDIVRALVSLKR